MLEQTQIIHFFLLWCDTKGQLPQDSETFAFCGKIRTQRDKTVTVPIMTDH
jgi:hypothetical protein